MRPGELLSIKKGDINAREGFIVIPHPKEKKPKIIYLLVDDIEILKEIPKGLPDLDFFRHTASIKGCRPGQKFGDRYLYKWWVKACNNLKIEGVDLYGGTRHSTTTALNERLRPEQIGWNPAHY